MNAELNRRQFLNFLIPQRSPPAGMLSSRDKRPIISRRAFLIGTACASAVVALGLPVTEAKAQVSQTSSPEAAEENWGIGGIASSPRNEPESVKTHWLLRKLEQEANPSASSPENQEEIHAPESVDINGQDLEKLVDAYEKTHQIPEGWKASPPPFELKDETPTEVYNLNIKLSRETGDNYIGSFDVAIQMARLAHLAAERGISINFSKVELSSYHFLTEDSSKFIKLIQWLGVENIDVRAENGVDENAANEAFKKLKENVNVISVDFPGGIPEGSGQIAHNIETQSLADWLQTHNKKAFGLHVDVPAGFFLSQKNTSRDPKKSEGGNLLMNNTILTTTGKSVDYAGNPIDVTKYHGVASSISLTAPEDKHNPARAYGPRGDKQLFAQNHSIHTSDVAEGSMGADGEIIYYHGNIFDFKSFREYCKTNNLTNYALGASLTNLMLYDQFVGAANDKITCIYPGGNSGTAYTDFDRDKLTADGKKYFFIGARLDKNNPDHLDPSSGWATSGSGVMNLATRGDIITTGRGQKDTDILPKPQTAEGVSYSVPVCLAKLVNALAEGQDWKYPFVERRTVQQLAVTAFQIAGFEDDPSVQQEIQKLNTTTANPDAVAASLGGVLNHPLTVPDVATINSFLDQFGINSDTAALGGLVGTTIQNITVNLAPRRLGWGGNGDGAINTRVNLGEAMTDLYYWEIKAKLEAARAAILVGESLPTGVLKTLPVTDEKLKKIMTNRWPISVTLTMTTPNFPNGNPNTYQVGLMIPQNIEFSDTVAKATLQMEGLTFLALKNPGGPTKVVGRDEDLTNVALTLVLGQ